MSKKVVIGNMIRYFLKENKMTMKQLGNELGKSESNISKWISGASTPQAKELAKMSFIFNTDIDTLMFGNNSLIIGNIVKVVKELDADHQEKVYDFAKYQLLEQKSK